MKQCGALIGASSTAKLLRWIERENARKNSSATCSSNGGPFKRGNHLRACYRAGYRAPYRACYRAHYLGKQSISALLS